MNLAGRRGPVCCVLLMPVVFAGVFSAQEKDKLPAKDAPLKKEEQAWFHLAMGPHGRNRRCASSFA